MKTSCYYHLCVAIASIMFVQAPALGQTFYSQVISNDQPLAYWNFDEASGDAIQQMPVPASPTTVNDLVPAFGATRVAHGAIASGLLLGNTADFPAAGNFSTVIGTLDFGQASLVGPYAIELWLQRVGVMTPTKVPLSFHNGADQSLYYFGDAGENPGYLELYGGGAGGRTGTNSLFINTTNTDWHHVVYVFYGSMRATNKVDGYLDGVRLANLSGYDRALLLSIEVTVGDYTPSSATGASWPGRVDEVAIYDWASYANLSEIQLAAKATAMVNDHRLAATNDAGGVTVDITQQPADATGSVGGTTNFTVAATASSGSLAYQWQKDWLDIPDATNATYTTPTLTGGDSGAIFRARVSSSNAFTYSREAALTVQGFTITISQQPTNVTANVGDTAAFSVVATSSPPTQLSYQWKKNDVNIPNETNASYTIPVIKLQDVGTNLFKVRVSVGATFVDSDEVALVVAAPAPINTLYSQIVSNDLPLAYWNFDEAQGNAIQLMPVPSSPTTVNDLVPAFGAFRADHAALGSGLGLGYCAEFNGANNFNAPLPDLGQTVLFTPYAVEFWLQLQGSGAINVPLGFDNAGDRSIYYNNVPNALELYGGPGGRTGAGSISINTTNRDWHHVMYVFYGDLRGANKVDGYLDGVRLANIAGYDQGLRLVGPLTVGDYRPLGGAGWRGRLDEVAIYDFSAFADEASLTNHVNDLVARHVAAALPPALSPVLSIARTGSDVVLSWPAQFAGFTLECNTNLTNGAWTTVGTQNPSTNAIGSGNKFFRLRNP